MTLPEILTELERACPETVKVLGKDLTSDALYQLLELLERTKAFEQFDGSDL